jgi:nitrogenase molybdenum-iron protein alpha/beta subunit
MKGLRKYISPFTPDQSGAVSVLFGYGGMLIIMDAGGCVGNICGYDEPRWSDERSAIFSAGLRDLDAILGRDDLLIRKTKDALRDVEAKFVGLIGTPVPAVIATDYRALKRLMEKDYGLPVIPVETNGMELYDKGQEMAYLELFGEFMGKPDEDDVEDHEVGIIGATPLDTVSRDSAEDMTRLMSGYRSAVCYGVGDSIGDIRRADRVLKNYVVSPSGLAAAREMNDAFGIPYETGYPVARSYADIFAAKAAANCGKKVLVVHQQIFANEIRKIICEACRKTVVDVATWFMLDEEISKDGDSALREENDFLELVNERGYDTVIGDPLLKRALPGWKGTYLSLPHYAISGVLHSSDDSRGYWEKAGERI